MTAEENTLVFSWSHSRGGPQRRRHTASIGTLQRIAHALDVDIAALLGPSRPVSGAGEAQAQIHQITAAILPGLGATDLGHVAAREAVRLAALTSDPLRAATARSSLGHVLIRQGRFVDAERLYVTTAQNMQSEVDASIAHLSVCGGVLLGGATSAARRMPPDSAMPLISRCRHLVDVAHAQLRLGHDRVAESALLTMERAAPEWTAHQQLPRVLVGELMSRGRPSAQLRELAHRLGATRAPQPSSTAGRTSLAHLQRGDQDHRRDDQQRDLDDAGTARQSDAQRQELTRQMTLCGLSERTA